MPRKTVDTFTRMFQYKIINNVLYINKMLFIFKNVDTPLCPFCKSKDETPLHLFYDCIVTQCLWKQLCSLCRHKRVIPELTPRNERFNSKWFEHIPLL